MKQVIEEKQAKVAEIKEKIAQSSSVVVTDYRGLNVEEVTQLRSELRKEGVEYKVLKNNLVRRACEESGIDGLEDVLKGPTAVAFSDDAVAPAKVLFEFLKKHKNLQVKGGLLEGNVVEVTELEALSKLPAKEVLLGQVVGAFVAPLQKAVSLFAAPMRDFVGAVNALKEKQEN